MNSATRLRVLISVVLLTTGFCLATSPAHAQAGQSGLAFLKLGISGRTVAMADAASASVSGAAATHYNPAGLLGTAGAVSQLMVMHKEWIQGVRAEFLGASLLLNDENAVGLAVTASSISDIEIRTRPGAAEGTFTARDLSVGASFARRISDDLQIGVTAKVLYEKILVWESTGFAFDIGGQFQTPVEHLRAGAAITNIGSAGAMQSQKVTLPTSVRLGTAYNLPLEEYHATALLAADLLHVIPEGKAYLGLGGEFTFNDTFSARVGYQFGSRARGIAAGAGVQYGIISVDYAFSPLSLDLGTGHTLSLALNL